MQQTQTAPNYSKTIENEDHLVCNAIKSKVNCAQCIDYQG